MHQIIDLQTELLIDQSTIRDPYLRLLAVVIGEQVLSGSPWLAIDKTVAAACRFHTSPGLATAPINSKPVNQCRIRRDRKTRQCA